MKFPFSRFIVFEESMAPAYKVGDHLLTFNWGKIKAQNAVVFKLDGKSFLKRVDKIVDNYVYISGDNKEKSAKMNPVKKEQILGKVILKY